MTDTSDPNSRYPRTDSPADPDLSNHKNDTLSPRTTRRACHRILFVSNIVTISGAEHILLEHLRHTEDHVQVIAPAGRLLVMLQEAGITVTRGRWLGELRRDRNRLWPLAALGRIAGTTIDILRLARRSGAEVLVANNFAAGVYVAVAARLVKRPWIWFIYDILPPGSLEMKVLQRLASHAAAIVAASDAVRRHLHEAGVSRHLIHVIYNGIDTEGRFRPRHHGRNSLKDELGMSRDTPVVAFIGQLSPHKGPQLLVEVARTLFEERGAHVVLVGAFPPQHQGFKQDLLRRVRESGVADTVHFAGQRDPSTVLDDIDIVAVPSLFPDPLPTVVLEAMSMKKIVVAANVGGVPEMITHGVNGYLFDEGDAAALRRLLLSLLADPPPHVGDAARLRVQQAFSLPAKISAFDELVDRVLTRTASESP